MMPDNAHQSPAPIENVLAAGLSFVVGSSVEAPIPIPIMFRISCVTRAVATPARMAPQDTLLSRIVRASSAGVTDDKWSGSAVWLIDG